MWYVFEPNGDYYGPLNAYQAEKLSRRLNSVEYQADSLKEAQEMHRQFLATSEGQRWEQWVTQTPQPEPEIESAKQKKPARKPVRSYGFDTTGQIYIVSNYEPEQWEALKARLGEVIEVEAHNQPEAWKKYDEIRRGQKR